MNIAVVASMLDVFGLKKFNYLKINQTNIFFFFFKFIFNINTLKKY
jgi:hypothetical protein